jgi:hypothetical protein
VPAAIGGSGWHSCRPGRVVSLDRKRWALLAQDLKFSQLDIARKQAETWRTGLATLTALLTGVLVVKGRVDASVLILPFQVVVAVLLGLALVLLLGAIMWVSRALAGPPGEEILLTGEGLEQWTQDEVRKISKALHWVPLLAAASVLIVAAAVAFTWFAPAHEASTTTLVQVTGPSGQSCGELVGVSNRQLVIRTTTTTTLIPLSAVGTITPVTVCG